MKQSEMGERNTRVGLEMEQEQEQEEQSQASLQPQDPTYDYSAMFNALPHYHHHQQYHHQQQQYAPANYYVNPYAPVQPPQSTSNHSRVSSDHEYQRNLPQYHQHPFQPPPNQLQSTSNHSGYLGTMNPPNSFTQGNYHHHFPIWYDQHNGRHDAFWPYGSGNPTGFMYPSQLNPMDHYYSHHPPAASYRVHPSPLGAEMSSSQPPGFRHQRNDSLPVATLRQHRNAVPRKMLNAGFRKEDVKKHMITRKCSGIQDNEAEPCPCTICLESYKNGEKIATLGCGHEYHVKCLEKWLVVRKFCPICKKEASVMEKRREITEK